MVTAKNEIIDEIRSFPSLGRLRLDRKWRGCDYSDRMLRRADALAPAIGGEGNKKSPPTHSIASRATLAVPIDLSKADRAISHLLNCQIPQLLRQEANLFSSRISKRSNVTGTLDATERSMPSDGSTIAQDAS